MDKEFTFCKWYRVAKKLWRKKQILQIFYKILLSFEKVLTFFTILSSRMQFQLAIYIFFAKFSKIQFRMSKRKDIVSMFGQSFRYGSKRIQPI